MADNLCYVFDSDINSVKKEISRFLSEDLKKSYIKTQWSGDLFSIKIEKAGTSELSFLVEDKDNKVSITEDRSKRKVALMHKPFIGEVEKIIHELLSNKMGGTKKA